jgi:endonuclease YncB( thermonuclease family)
MRLIFPEVKRRSCASIGHSAARMSGRALVLLSGMALTWVGDACAQAAPSQDRCRFKLVGNGVVSAVTDGRTFVLGDGREVRLDAIEIPLLPSSEQDPRAEAGQSARNALANLLIDRKIELRQRVSGSTDRYGRLIAFAYLANAPSTRSAGHEMLAAGYARVAARVGDRACAAELLAHESAARDAALGLWGKPVYSVIRADSGTQLLDGRGHFTLAEGKILSVRESGGTIYMNFGRRGSQALTVTILKRHERIFSAAGIAPNRLENRHVRVRGWVEERNGPRIEATGPEQIEIVERN